jgi:hypothetical protein
MLAITRKVMPTSRHALNSSQRYDAAKYLRHGTSSPHSMTTSTTSAAGIPIPNP